MRMLPILLLLMIHPFVGAFPFYGSEVQRASAIALAPSPSSTQHPTERSGHKFILHHQRLHGRKKVSAPTYFLHPPNYSPQGPSPSPTTNWVSAAPGPLPRVPSKQLRKPVLHPAISPVGSSLQNNNLSPPPPPPPPIFSLPLPPRNEDCASVTCAEPLTYTPSDSPCGCVAPLHIRLIFDVALYTFFPLVSELANEIATAFSLFPRQVRIMGANAASQQPQKTVILINLVPFKLYFDSLTAFSVYYKFWHKQVLIMTPLFGAYEVLSVSYPGLPESPPSVSSTIYDGPYPGHGKDGMPKKPFGVDVPKQKRDGIGGRTIAIIALVSTIAFIACMGFVLLLLLKSGTFIHRSENLPNESIPMPRKPSEEAAGSMIVENKTSSTSMFLSYSMQTYTGSAKTFSAQDIESATEKFDNSRILGEGGFGLVYSGTLDDGRKVAVKVLKRDDKQGSREFLAEVEMLSRLHHRNLVKLIGICVEDHTRCLVYELVPNGSVESHLHGVDKAESLDWAARMKIALGAARGLAYLHEDSSPCVIHRDFKSSNILLEPDFTPKVSDFGLARTAMDEGNKHISTHVMGTFGYLAPEYAMTGHLLVKSDVYSYGVVLLELLSGRKPVDFSQPPGQENLVSFARPLLTSKEGLKLLVDPTISSNTAFDSIAKVAAIASMCVQPEVSHRPFMGEVVQALKLVCSEFDETKEGEGSRNCAKEHFYMEIDSCLDAEKIRGNEGWELGSFGRSFRSGPLETEGRKQFWEKEVSRGSVSEHSFAFTLPQGSH